MKKLFVLSIAMIFAFGMSAQKIGVKAGYGMSGYLVNYYTPDGSVMSTGFNAGLVAELDLKVIGIRADVTFQQLGSDYDSRNDSDQDRATNFFVAFLGGEYEYMQSINYINVGVSVKKGFGPAYVFVGPYIGYAIQGTQKSTFTPSTGDAQTWTDDIFSLPNKDIDFAQALSDDNNFGGDDELYNKIDFGANFGVGASFSGVFVEANIAYGFMNFINQDYKYGGDDPVIDAMSVSYEDLKASKVTKDDKTVAMTDGLKQNNLFFSLSVGYMFGF